MSVVVPFLPRSFAMLVSPSKTKFKLFMISEVMQMLINQLLIMYLMRFELIRYFNLHQMPLPMKSKYSTFYSSGLSTNFIKVAEST